MKDILKPLGLSLDDNSALATLLQTFLTETTPSQWCQAYYLFAATAVVAVAAMPKEVRRLLVDYGARKSTKSASASEPEESEESEKVKKSKEERKETRGTTSNWGLRSLVSTLTSHGQVPHSWFITFYVASVACSVFWLWQFWREGRVLEVVASSQVAQSYLSEKGNERGHEGAVTLGQVGLVWTMMFLQGSRRLYEDLLVHGKKSKSTMWIVHWVLGLSYYFFTSVAVWVEGSGKMFFCFLFLNMVFSPDYV